ncbi:hypothetical protein OF83DRAFT_597568 [Amylostereum chailletii]|nr:hypothetical protein OF83DRAFT_597568 [Amylostereum chailletii]
MPQKTLPTSCEVTTAAPMPFLDEASPSGPHIPTELIYDIVEFTLATFWRDLVMEPTQVEDWNAVIVLLQVTQAFRSGTIQCMDPLWGGKLIEDGENIKQTLSLLRRYSEVSQSFPEELVRSPMRPRVGHPLLQESKVPIVKFLRHFIGVNAKRRVTIKHLDWDSALSYLTPESDIAEEVLTMRMLTKSARNIIGAAMYDFSVEYLIPCARGTRYIASSHLLIYNRPCLPQRSTSGCS